jgi:hypothetical protein
MVRPCSENSRRRLPKIALKWMPETKESTRKTEENWMECTRKAMNERNLN